ncbi:MAG TPA: histidine kinase dimerization/phospho-acceptor domain-containing protein, partial [Daejeonella sp.]|nr:histidine kinase dimerization/phospho-acceptor domain-containing protein [Daejeonella sp.]
MIAVGLLLLPDKSEGKYGSQPPTRNIDTEADHNVIKDLQNEKKYFAGVLSHDLRSPLSSIILITSYLKSKDATSGNNQYLELV